MVRWPRWLADRPTPAIRVVVGTILAVLTVAALVIPSNLSSFPPIAQAAAVAVGGALAGSGMIAWERRPGNPIGALLIVAGALWILGRLQGAAWPPLGLAATLGNALSQTVLVVALVAFPSGRITSRAGWAVVAFGGIAIVGLSLTMTITTEFRDTPAIHGPNPLYVPLDATLRTFLRGGFQVATSLVAIVGIGWLVTRWWHASGPARRTFLPIFVAGVLISAITMIGELLVNNANLTATAYQAVVTIQILSFALFPVAILVGVLRDRMARGTVADVVVELGDTPAPERMREALAGALGDPSLEVVYWSPTVGIYVDADGVPIDPLRDAGARAVTHLERDGRPLAAILHDPALAEDPGLVGAVAAAVRLAVDNERLTAEVSLQLAEVRASRARIVEASDAERRRVERNLHDGAQQRLVALSIALRRAQAQLPDGATPELAATLESASDQLRSALAELRDLARGIHPAILTEAGLGPALRALARESPLPVSAEVTLDPEPPAPVAAAAYFVASEALANVAKYAPAAHVVLRADADGSHLRLEVVDDGPGGADPAAGSGLRGLADRVAAHGGSLDISSAPGRGTRIVATLPLGTDPVPPSAREAPATP